MTIVFVVAACVALGAIAILAKAAYRAGYEACAVNTRPCERCKSSDYPRAWIGGGYGPEVWHCSDSMGCDARRSKS